MTEHDQHMSKAEAIGILCHLAMRKDLTIDEVIAIQTACRSTLKRFFDKERWHKRHHAANQPAEAISQNPPFAGAQESD